MIVTDRQLAILGVVACVLFVATILLYGVERKRAVEAQRGALLVQGLELGEVASVKVSAKDKSVTLEKKDGKFVVAERNGYPASVKKVNDLFLDILGIRIAEKVTSSTDNHKELGVVQGGEEATVVEFVGKEGKALVGVVIGKSASRGSGKYVRLADQDTVYTSEKSLWLNSDVTQYLDSDIVDVKKDDVERVEITVGKEHYAIVRNDKKKIVLDAVPEGRKQKDWEVESAFDALSSLSFNDVVVEKPKDLAFDATCVCRTKKHQTYTVQLAKKGDKHYAKFACQGPSDAEIERASRIRKDEPKEKLVEKDAILTARDAADAFNEKHGPWLYELSNWKAEKMRKPVKDLTEEKPKDKDPEEVAARHILVAYKGAERADAKITRSKEEAKKRAEELLKKVKEKDADFAAIAKAESDGPSKTKGGDLGTFKRGAMHKNFEEAAWKLEVDEISDVVETPFGFHIIQRTK
jgi:hypothetical protein